MVTPYVVRALKNRPRNEAVALSDLPRCPECGLIFLTKVGLASHRNRSKHKNKNV